MKKLTAGVFATILGLTAVDAFAGTKVASTSYVQSAIESLDSEKNAGENKYISGVKIVDGKISSIAEGTLPTVPSQETINAGINMTEAKATEGNYISAVQVQNGALTISEKALPTGINDADQKATAGNYVSAVKVQNGTLTISESALPTVPSQETINAGINMNEAKATEGKAVAGVKVVNGQLQVTDTATLFTDTDRDSTTKTVTAGQVLDTIAMENGEFVITSKQLEFKDIKDAPTMGDYVLVADVVDVYPYVAPAQAE